MAEPVISPADPDVLRRLDAVPVLADPARRVIELPGGLTNRNFRVTTATGDFVARLSNDAGKLLGIDRDAEATNSRAAATTGIAPEVVDYRPEVAVLVVRWISGRTLREVDLADDGTLQRVVQSCRRLHAGPVFAGDFDMFAVQRGYLQTAQQRGFSLPDGYTAFMPQVAALEKVLAMHPVVPVPCHNDLLPENLIDAPDQVWLIDFEYAGNNDPCFELGNIASEAHLDPTGTEALAMAYFGPAGSRWLPRIRLQSLMSQYGWTLWGVIQDHVSAVRIDYRAWALDKYERAAAMFTSSGFDRLLAAAADP